MIETVPMTVEVLRERDVVVIEIDDPARSFYDTIPITTGEARQLAAELIVMANKIDEEDDA